MLLDRKDPGDRDRARSLIDDAAVICRRIGMPRPEERAQRLLTS